MVCFWKNVASSDCSSTLSRARDSLSCGGAAKKGPVSGRVAELNYTSAAHMMAASLPTATTLSYSSGGHVTPLSTQNPKTHQAEAPDEAAGPLLEQTVMFERLGRALTSLQGSRRPAEFLQRTNPERPPKQTPGNVRHVTVSPGLQQTLSAGNTDAPNKIRRTQARRKSRGRTGSGLHISLPSLHCRTDKYLGNHGRSSKVLHLQTVIKTFELFITIFFLLLLSLSVGVFAGLLVCMQQEKDVFLGLSQILGTKMRPFKAAWSPDVCCCLRGGGGNP